MKNWKKYLLLITFLLATLLFIAIHFIAPYAITQPPRINEPIAPATFGLTSFPIHIHTDDDIDLNGYWTPSQQDSARGIIILVHGIGGCKEYFLSLAQELSERGIESIVFDGRAHGQSGGAFCTYGFKEKRDIARVVDWIKAERPKLPIGIWGNSMGGAIALQALALDERLDFGIIESTFTELDQIVYDYKKRHLKGVGLRWLSDYALMRAGKIADFDPEAVKPIQSVQQIEQPIFLAHGDADANISVEYGRQLFQHLKSSDKTLEIVEGAGHFNLYIKGGAEYKAKVLGFVERNVQ